MNYRHAFHAGNFADVLKHQLLAWQLEHLQKKSTPFFVMDTHAGIGLYDFNSEAAQRSPEYLSGIDRVKAALPKSLYLRALEELNEGNGPLRYYPGSPYLIQMALRDQDRALLCELHPEDAKTLHYNIFDQRKTRVDVTNGFQALAAHLPPIERRGLILIDPAFEDRDEFSHLLEGLHDALKRFRHGTYLVWYPIKNAQVNHQFKRNLETLALPETMLIEITLNPQRTPSALHQIGFLIVNPAWGIEEKINATLPELLRLMNQGNDYQLKLKRIGDHG